MRIKNKKSPSFFFSFHLFLFASFFEQWAPPYFLSCHEQCSLFEFPSLAVILKHNICFINTILLLAADPLSPFTLLLFSLVFPSCCWQKMKVLLACERPQGVLSKKRFGYFGHLSFLGKCVELPLIFIQKSKKK